MKENELVAKAVADLKNDEAAGVKEIFIEELIPSVKPTEIYEKMEIGDYITEDQASKVDAEGIMKEIEAEGPEKVVKMPVGMKIDEVDA